jgi:hypothetical protein
MQTRILPKGVEANLVVIRFDLLITHIDDKQSFSLGV